MGRRQNLSPCSQAAGPPRRDPGSPGGITGPGRGRSAPLSHRVSWLHLGTGGHLCQPTVFPQREVSRFMASRVSPLGAGTRAELGDAGCLSGCLHFKDKTAFWVTKPTRGLFSFDKGLDASQRDREPILNGRFPKETLSGQGREVPFPVGCGNVFLDLCLSSRGHKPQ